MSALNADAVAAALADGRIEPAFQPIARLSDGALAGFEALARLRLDGVLLEPDRFFPAAAEAGLIGRINSHMLIAASAALGRWRGSVPEAAGLFVAVNISGRDLERIDIVEEALAARAAAALPPRALKLEITEHQIVRDPALARRTLMALRVAGLSVAFDDFGAGFNSLRWLADLPADTLKIDQSFVSAIDSDERSLKIVRALVALAHELELDVVAEGVEREAVRELLATIGCDYAQGHLFSPALNAAAAEAVVTSLAAA